MKCKITVIGKMYLTVALLVSAWIEIRPKLKLNNMELVALLVSAWIEITVPV